MPPFRLFVNKMNEPSVFKSKKTQFLGDSFIRFVINECINFRFIGRLRTKTQLQECWVQKIRKGPQGGHHPQSAPIRGIPGGVVIELAYDRTPQHVRVRAVNKLYKRKRTYTCLQQSAKWPPTANKMAAPNVLTLMLGSALATARHVCSLSVFLDVETGNLTSKILLKFAILRSTSTHNFEGGA